MDSTLLDNLKGESIKEPNEIDLKKCKTLEDVEESLIRNSSKPRYRYTKDELLKFRDNPLSTKTPSLNYNLKFLFENNVAKAENKDEFEIKKSVLKKPGPMRIFEKSNDKADPVKKIEITRSEKPTVTFRTDKLEDNRKSSDPASRIRKESEICLSPQRKSFNSGCSVQNAKVELQGGSETPVNPNINMNPKQNGQKESMLSNVGGLPRDNRNEIRDHRSDLRDNRLDSRDNRNDMRENRNDSREIRNRDVPPRRIGSGRIISSDPSVIRDYPESRMITREKPPQVVFKCTFPKSTDKDRDSRDSVWDRQRSVMPYDRRKFSDQYYESDSREQQQRVNNFFERRKQYVNDYHREENEPEWMKDGPDSKHDFIELRGFDEDEMKSFRRGGNSRVVHSANSKNEKTESSSRNTNGDGEVTKSQENSSSNEVVRKVNRNDSSKNTEPLEASSIELNLDEIFKAPLPDISEDKVENSGSRFTRWFRRDDESSNLAGQASADSIDIENKKCVEHNLNEVIKKSGNDAQSNSNIMDLFRTNQENKPAAVDVRVLEASGKLHSLEEIEAKLRGTDSSKQNELNPDRKKKEEESEAFKKLLFQALQTNSGSSGASKFMENNTADINEAFMQKIRFDSQNVYQGKPNFPAALCNGDSYMNLQNPVASAQLSKMQSMQHQMQLQQQQRLHQQQLHQQQQSADVLRLLQQQQRQNKSQQEILSRMLVPGSNFNANVPASVNRPPQADGPYAHVSQEIQACVNDYHINQEVVKRPETKNILAAIRRGKFAVYDLIEELKKSAPYMTRFRETALCILKYLQLHEPELAVCSPASLSFSVPPPAPPHAPPQSSHFGETAIHQMIMNQQMRNAMPDIVYQRDFSVHNQNAFQNNVVNPGKRFPIPQQVQNLNQTPIKVTSSLMNISNNSLPNTLGNANVQLGRENKAAMSPGVGMNSPSNAAMPKSLSFTPTSVLLKLSAKKENVDHSAQKESNELKSGEELIKHSGIGSASVKNLFVNGMAGSGEDQLNRLFSSENQSRLLPANSIPAGPVQNMMSLEEVERVQQSVRN